MSSSLGVPGQSNNGDSSVKKAISAVDASTILLRLAGIKQPQKKGEAAVSNEQKDKNKGKRRRSSYRNSISISEAKAQDKKATCETDIKSTHDDGDEVPDWLTDELDENALSNFRDLFNMLDKSKTGIITADKLFEEMRRVDSEITYSEVEDVLRKVDKDGNGEIDFDEFLLHMTNMGGNEEEGGDDEEQRKKKRRRKRMFYNAITHFSIKQTLADIERNFRMQAPHVISHYAAGVRLIGLTTRQLERQMKKMQKSAAKNDSPYAKPLQFVQLSRDGKTNIVHRKKTKTIKEMPESSKDLHQTEVSEEEPDLTKKIQDTMMLFAKKEGSIVPQDANIFIKLRQKLGSVTAWMQQSQPPDESAHLNLSTMPTLNKPKSAWRMKMTEDKQSVTRSETKSAPVKQSGERASERKLGRTKKKNVMTALGWTPPRIQYLDVPLPSLKMQLTEKPTFNDLHRIRAKAKRAIDAYYQDLRQAEIRNAWDHWDQLYADVIVPKKLLNNFRTVYSAYSPHREEEAFVVCPWKPGPFSFLRHLQNPPIFVDPKSAHVTITGKVRHKSCNVRPKTVSHFQTARRINAVLRNTPSPIGTPSSQQPDTNIGSII
ncbi:uncharacterized protein LOC123524514 [Mercenaria mercenaria]|uniref:uncharacterized protein LOC123524514 n=1 Tax=Mercenaria mercenaria TaxID=6596 RepID=UPI00234E73A6|nr:uncharacterized protein LOC123524514 [Mercenaria mercenaria]